MTAILGISAYYHDSAAAMVIDGRIVAAAQEERFSRLKHDSRFPKHAVDFCLEHSGLSPNQLDYIAFYDKPITKFERLLETYLAFAPAGYRSFRQAIPIWLKQKLHLPREIECELSGSDHASYVFTEHHESHAASAFFPSPFDEAAILTIDGVGEWSTSCCGVGRGNKIELMEELRFPHSLGLLYSAFTYYTGFRVNSGEYKVMGLAPYGEPIYRDLILNHLLDLKDDGSFRLDMSYFDYCQGLRMTSSRFHDLFGGPPREPDTELSQRDMDLAASVQAVTEEIMLRISHHVHAKTGLKRLVMAGGVALNCVGIGRIQREGPFEQIWVQPAAGDAGGALGAALFVWHQLLDNPRHAQPTDSQQGSLLGPTYSDAAIHQTLRQHGANFVRYDYDEQLCEETAKLLAAQKVIGWFQGRMEFGPRALGSRSILADPRGEQMQDTINKRIKFRESFRPFAPVVLREKAHRYFELPPSADSPYMTLAAPVKQEWRIQPESELIEPQGGNAVNERDATASEHTLAPVGRQNLAAKTSSSHVDIQGLGRLHARRSQLPAITHVDYSARIQTVDADGNHLLHQLLVCFDKQTDCPVLVNTSFNVRGEPIICSPDDAYRCFMNTHMDTLVIGRYILHKDQQHPMSDGDAKREHSSRDTKGNGHGLRSISTSLVDVNWSPSRRQMRQFGILCLVALLAGSWLGNARYAVWISTTLLGAVTAVTGLLFPFALRPLYRAALILTIPIGMVLGEMIMLTIFFACFWPLSLLLRVMKRDALQLQLNRQQKTYWESRKTRTDMASYFHQS